MSQPRHFRGRRTFRRKPDTPRPIDAVRAEINVTPLVDVCLVLLIIFMVVTPMLQRGMDVELPAARRATEERDTGERLVVSVRQGGAVFIDQAQVTLPDLERYVRLALGHHAGRPIFVKADARLRYGQVREVMEACHRAGSTQVALATQETREAKD
ncbi:MAG: biopolymer transporter ExbD [Myxococcota bacterium]